MERTKPHDGIKNKKQNKLLVIALILSLSLLILCTYLLVVRSNKDLRGFIRNNPSLTNPVNEYIKNISLSVGERILLQEKLESGIQASIASGAINEAGVYYRELISGPTIALNQDEDFAPASLLKLPIAFWYYKKAEMDPGILTQEVEFTGPPGVSIEHYPPADRLVPGITYSIESLIEHMLVDSDNDATQILTEFAGGREEINTVYYDLGIRGVDDYSKYVIDVQTYSALFRVLFNEEYLNHEFSERILTMLSKSSFTQGLTHSLPASILVAHKFGERIPTESVGLNQLHDCGIVYAPNNPYLLCIMTRGKDYTQMAAFIADFSKKYSKPKNVH